MKILIVAPYITYRGYSQFLKNQTGFGYMVYDIAQSLSKLARVDLFTLSAFTRSMQIGNIHIVGRNWVKILFCLSFQALKSYLLFSRKYALPLNIRFKNLYYYIAMGQLESIVSKYDILHIQGCSPITNFCIEICRKKKVPFLITLHGLNSFENNIKVHKSFKQYERDFIEQSYRDNFPVSFISTGNMHKACEFLGRLNVDNFSLVTNGCHVEPIICENEGLRSKYKISQSDFVFVCVGNISDNKNQIQVAKAYNLLSGKDKQYIKILFIGQFNHQDPVVKYIADNDLSSSLILAGQIPKDKLPYYYSIANATVLASKAEGFGLSIIEGFVYGLPCLTFADLSAIPDLYNKEAMLLVDHRSDKELMLGMLRLVDNKYNSDKIKVHSKQFSLINMAEKYLKLYQKIVCGNNE